MEIDEFSGGIEERLTQTQTEIRQWSAAEFERLVLESNPQSGRLRLRRNAGEMEQIYAGLRDRELRAAATIDTAEVTQVVHRMGHEETVQALIVSKPSRNYGKTKIAIIHTKTKESF